MRVGRHVTRSEAETERVAAELARELSAGTVILLHGELGAGKTAFVRGVASGRGLDPDEVSSPTFVVIQEYGDARLQHVDLYRLGPDEVDDLGLDELSELGAVVCVEWAERWREPPPGAVTVRMTVVGEEERELTVSGIPQRPEVA